MAEAAEEQRLLRVQKNYIELEMRKFKRKKICSLHDLENQLLRDVSVRSSVCLESGFEGAQSVIFHEALTTVTPYTSSIYCKCLCA